VSTVARIALGRCGKTRGRALLSFKKEESSFSEEKEAKRLLFFMAR
jgi:hypothetical protein